MVVKRDNKSAALRVEQKEKTLVDRLGGKKVDLMACSTVVK